MTRTIAGLAGIAVATATALIHSTLDDSLQTEG